MPDSEGGVQKPPLPCERGGDVSPVYLASCELQLSEVLDGADHLRGVRVLVRRFFDDDSSIPPPKKFTIYHQKCRVQSDYQSQNARTTSNPVQPCEYNRVIPGYERSL